MTKHTTQQPAIKLCECGCGNPAPIAKVTDRTRGRVKGQPMRFLKGHVGKLQVKRPIEEKFWEKVDVGGPNDCWNWNASLSTKGYGILIINGVTTNAQRISWKLHFGPIPNGDGYHGTCVLHRCDNPRCVNPSHLFLGTHQDNMNDRNHKNRQARQFGTTNPSARLNEVQVQKIRHMAHEHVQHTDIANQFGVTVSLIEKIVARKIWKHV